MVFYYFQMTIQITFIYRITFFYPAINGVSSTKVCTHLPEILINVFIFYGSVFKNPKENLKIININLYSFFFQKIYSYSEFLSVFFSILLERANLRGGSQAFLFGTITFEITYDQCTIVVCTTFKGILRLLG